MNHPVHIHGRQFQVIKIGWPKYDNQSRWESENYDVKCDINKFCNKASWKDSTWNDGNVPGIINNGAPLKDTVLVPLGGYVVIRFLVNNPGKCMTIY